MQLQPGHRIRNSKYLLLLGAVASQTDQAAMLEKTDAHPVWYHGLTKTLPSIQIHRLVPQHSNQSASSDVPGD